MNRNEILYYTKMNKGQELYYRYKKILKKQSIEMLKFVKLVILEINRVTDLHKQGLLNNKNIKFKIPKDYDLYPLFGNYIHNLDYFVMLLRNIKSANIDIKFIDIDKEIEYYIAVEEQAIDIRDNYINFIK